MGRTYFISDAHLGLGSREEERQKENRLIAFLDGIQEDADQLFIVGDLFDAWFEYRTVILKGFHRLLAKLDECTERGIAVHYLAGNHDYWMKDYFQSELGIKTYHHPIETLIDGRKVLIHHGDGLSNKDTGYRILKKILNNPLSIWLFTWVHPDIGVSIARSSSRKSRQHTSGKEYGEEDGMLAFARKKIGEGFDIVVMGHRHSPVCVEIGSGVYVNLGDWIGHNTYAAMAGGRIELKQWRQGQPV
ncbi:MAG TPA: UDP-2,3-diacylglucosamine diphosphatase [Bacteroidota bacterium]|jgi:UDP-2,3-diacylglucosamine hydrolase